MTGALELMEMSRSATAPFDAESVAWHHAHIGHLLLELGRLDEAARAFAHADHVFPDHPAAIDGRTRLLVARGEWHAALRLVNEHVNAWPGPERLARLGDLHAALGDGPAAERAYQLAEAAWIADAPEPARLARFLAERDRHVDRALELARGEIRRRRDIFTEDALAWALYRTGRIDEAYAAITRALRTGTHDRAIRYHAAAIAARRGDQAGAREHVQVALAGRIAFDPIVTPLAQALERSLLTGLER